MKKEILTAMDYAVPEAQRPEAEDLLDLYQDDDLGLRLLYEFYTCLPEAEDDWVREIQLVNRRQGIFLLAAQTSAHRYLYLLSSEGIEFEGEVTDGQLGDELLDFFGYQDQDEFIQRAQEPGAFSVYEPLCLETEVCPACHVSVGERHELGCVVELCPWCGGQLVHCSCRYDQLGVDSITSEQQVLQFEAILEQRGRIPYSPEQRPSFLDEASLPYDA